MIWIILLLAIGGYIYWKGISEPAELEKLIQGRPQQQQDVIKYFFGKGGFLTKRITDAEYDNIVANTIKESNFKQKALAKIGLDESQVNEIEPVNFEGWLFGKNVGWAKYGLDNKARSSAYQITWLFFLRHKYIFINIQFILTKTIEKLQQKNIFIKTLPTSQLLPIPLNSHFGIII